MSQPAFNNLTKEKIQQLLNAVGAQPKENTQDNIETSDYNWKQARYFNRSQLETIEEFAKNVANKCGENFTNLYRNDFTGAITSISQHFAGEFSDPNNTQNHYYLAFASNEGQAFGLVCIPLQTAVVWTTELLGETKQSKEPDREFSRLEESLLSDIAHCIIKAFSDCCEGCDFNPDPNIIKDQLPVEIDDTRELCKITLKPSKAGSEDGPEAYLLLFCDRLQSLFKQNIQTGKNPSEQDIKKAMLEHIHKVPISVTARLGSAVLTFEEMMCLQADDILLMDKSVNEPLDLLIEGKTILRGSPVKCDGKYAVLITQLCSQK
jgi:flagellar motor switch protein FliN/FliY